MRRFSAALITAALLISPASGQQFFAPTTVQLPTFSTFAVSTTVSVPDSGHGFVAGQTQMSHGWTAYGPAWGADPICGCGQMEYATGWTASAQIIDLPAMDAALLAGAAPMDGRASDPFMRQLAVSRVSSAAHVPGSVAEARRARAEEQMTDDSELEDLIAKAESHLAGGKKNLARIYLQMAAGRATGERQRMLQAQAASLKEPRGHARPATLP